MKKLHNILVIVDPTAHEHPSVQKAAALARACNARLELYVCDTRSAREARLLAERAKDPRRPLTVNLKPMLEALAGPLRVQGIDVSTECDYAEILVEALRERVCRTAADLVVKDTHPHSLLQRTFITNTDWHLIRECPRPLLLTKPRAWRSPLTLLAAVDPGNVNDKPAALDKEILEWSNCVGQRSGAHVHVAHVYVPLTVAATAADVVAPLGSVLTADALQSEERQKREELTELLAPYGIAAERVHLELGVASDALPGIAQQLGADLMVMGAIARSGLKRLFIGSTAERVLEGLPCDVLVVKPPDFSAAWSG